MRSCFNSCADVDDCAGRSRPAESRNSSRPLTIAGAPRFELLLVDAHHVAPQLHLRVELAQQVHRRLRPRRLRVQVDRRRGDRPRRHRRLGLPLPVVLHPPVRCLHDEVAEVGGAVLLQHHRRRLGQAEVEAADARVVDAEVVEHRRVDDRRLQGHAAPSDRGTRTTAPGRATSARLRHQATADARRRVVRHRHRHAEDDAGQLDRRALPLCPRRRRLGDVGVRAEARRRVVAQEAQLDVAVQPKPSSSGSCWKTPASGGCAAAAAGGRSRADRRRPSAARAPPRRPPPPPPFSPPPAGNPDRLLLRCPAAANSSARARRTRSAGPTRRCASPSARTWGCPRAVVLEAPPAGGRPRLSCSRLSGSAVERLGGRGGQWAAALEEACGAQQLLGVGT